MRYISSKMKSIIVDPVALNIEVAPTRASLPSTDLDLDDFALSLKK